MDRHIDGTALRVTQMTASRFRKGSCGLLILCLSVFWGLLLCPSGAETQTASPASFREVAAYINLHGRLPDYFITKKEARALGWEPSRGNLWKVAPGKSIGGDIFHNRENKVPQKKDRIWHEADIGYRGGKRTPCRLVFSSDGLMYKTEDHYRTFTRIDP